MNRKNISGFFHKGERITFFLCVFQKKGNVIVGGKGFLSICVEGESEKTKNAQETDF